MLASAHVMTLSAPYTLDKARPVGMPRSRGDLSSASVHARPAVSDSSIAAKQPRHSSCCIASERLTVEHAEETHRLSRYWMFGELHSKTDHRQSDFKAAPGRWRYSSVPLHWRQLIINPPGGTRLLARAVTTGL
jgi:hypothetical protein